MLSTCLMFVGMGFGYTAARLDNSGRHKQAALVLGVFVFGLLGYLLYSLLPLWYDVE